MRIHHVLPEPIYKHYTCYPDSIGLYSDLPEHKERRIKGQLPNGNLHLVLGGRGFVIENGKETELTAGQGFYYGPMLDQEYRSDPKDPWKVFWAHLTGDGSDKLFNGRGSSSVWLFSYDDLGRLETLTDELLKLATPYNRNEVGLASKVYELLALLASGAENIGFTNTFDKRARMKDAAEYIRNHCTDALSLAQIAEYAGFSPAYFSRIFHEEIGRTPMEWLFESRLAVAKQLLVSTEWSVKQVAESCGHNQSSYFISRFKEHTGLTPQEYRRMYQF